MSAGSLRRSSGPGSSNQLSFYEERCVDPVEDRQPTPEHKAVHKARLKDADRKESETIGFIPGSADPSSSAQTCNPCASPRSCKTFVCSVLTCGLYRVCQRSILAPCLAPNESSPDEPEKVSLRGEKPRDSREEDGIEYPDLCIAGVEVSSPREYFEVETKSYLPPPGPQTQQGYPSLHESMRFDDWDDGEEDVDSLITKKLLELYSEYQIEELARCTSDSVFLRKSKAINQLINSLADEHKMDEQEAECRLVRGIIRISTRKSSKKRPVISRVERTLSDSGNETMTGSGSFSFSNNNDYRSNPNIQISELTYSDKFARDMWRKNGGSSTAYSRSHTETDSSGIPLIHTSKLVEPVKQFVPPHLICSLTKRIFVDPVRTKLGAVYERKAIEKHLSMRRRFDPLDPKSLFKRTDLKPDKDMKKMVKDYRSNQIQETSV